MNFEELFSSTGKGRPSFHPYANMAVGEIIPVPDSIDRMQVYAHVYGRSSGKKFQTRRKDGVLYVKRVS